MSLTNYFKKLDVKHTPFNMSNHAPYTADFGQLLPTYVNDVLASDEWAGSIAESIKTAPLVAPSLLKLSNNNYGFFTPNACVWKHWNDFISNGSMVQDTITTSAQKDEIASRYKIPAIPANLMQLCLKIANGWAMPIYVIKNHITDTDVVNSIDTMIEYTSELAPALDRLGYPKISIEGFGDCSVYVGSAACASAIRSLIVEGDVIPENINKIRFTNDYMNFASGKSMPSYWLLFKNDVASSPDMADAPVIYSENYAKVWQEVGSVANHTDGFPTKVRFADFRINPDWFSNRRAVNVSYSQTGDTTAHNSTWRATHGNKTFATGVLTSGQWKCTYIDATNRVRNISVEVGSTLLDTMFDSNGDLLDSFKALFPAGAHEICFYLGTSTINNFFVTDNLVESYIALSSLVENTIQPVGTADSNFNKYAFELPYCDLMEGYVGDVESAYEGYMSELKNTKVPYTTWYTTSALVNCSTSLQEGFSESVAAGYISDAWVHYLCTKVSKLVEHMDIPIEPLVTRSFLPFCDVNYNALPFMGYSKIWNDYFRNSTIQSPELCYADVNGLLYNTGTANDFRTSLGVDCNATDEKSVYYVDTYNNNRIGWCLTYHSKPLELSQGNYATIMIDSLVKAFSLMTGYCMSEILCPSLISPTAAEGSHSPWKGVFIPNYYNSLCGVKYKNISKSVFTSGMLEPNNGAKIEEIPDTIIELRSATALQKFWERTAVARSIKKWYQTVFGSTPSHDDYDSPLLLGKASSNIQIGEILQQSQTTDTSSLGDRAGVALGGGKGGIMKHYFNEHGFVMVLSSITMDVAFCDGLSQYSIAKRSYLDYPYIFFSQIGNEGLPTRLLSSFPPPSALATASSWNTFTDDTGTCILDKSATDASNSDSWSFGSLHSPLGNASMLVPKMNMVQRRGQYPNGTMSAYNMSNLSLIHHHKYDATDQSKEMTLINTSGYLETPFSYVPRYSEYKIKLDRCYGEFRNTMKHWVGFQRVEGCVGYTHFFITWEFRVTNNDLGRFFSVTNPAISAMFYVDRYNNFTCKRTLPYCSTPK